ncbi:MAG: cupin domain-containing protein [Candidatus Hodarchaeales archaeon]
MLQLTSRIYPLRIPLLPDAKRGWKPYSIFKGFTAGLGDLSCHVSVLVHGHCPHSPHRHKEEELLLLLSGEVDLILPGKEASNENQRMNLKPGQFVYYPANLAHTLQTTSDAPANYLMLKWHGETKRRDSVLAFGQFDLFDQLKASKIKGGFSPHMVFEGPTDYLRKLHCHTSTLTSGAGYDPHIDPYDVVIIILEGEVETLGEGVGPHSVIFYAAGEPHGIRNPGEARAKYVVFEFHGCEIVLAKRLFYLVSSIFFKLINPRRWKRNLKYLLNRFKL